MIEELMEQLELTEKTLEHLYQARRGMANLGLSQVELIALIHKLTRLQYDLNCELEKSFQFLVPVSSLRQSSAPGQDEKPLLE